MANCPSCGAAYPPGASYCASCGQLVGAAAATQTASSNKGMKTIIIVAVGAGCLVLTIAFSGIIAALLIPNFLDALQKAKTKRTVADMRTIATALESYRAEANAYPAASTSAELGPAISQHGYSGNFGDGWKRPLRYTCLANGEKGCDQYELASAGRDGVFENEPGGYAQEPFEPSAYDSDIVLANGEFTRWPQQH